MLAKLAQATSINWKAIYTLLKYNAKINRITMQCFALQGNLTVRETTAAGKSATAGANCRIALDARSACSAVACVPLRYANTCREPTEYIFGSHQRSSRMLAASFRSFLSAKKRTRFPFTKERICAFLTEEKSTKRLTETLSRTLMLLLGSVYPRLEDVAVLAELAQATTRRAGSMCRWEVCARRRKARAA